MQATLGQNELKVIVPKEQSCFFAQKFLRNQTFKLDLKPRVKGAFLARLLAGRLWDLYLEPEADQQVILAGNDPLGRFVCLEVPKGQLLYVRLRYLAAYQFREKGRFRRIIRLLSLANWLTRTPLAVCVEGPAWLAFYGNDLSSNVYEAGEGIFCDQVVGMDARATFDFEGLPPDKSSFLGQSLNVISTTVFLKMQNATEVVYSTVRKEGFSRLITLLSLLFGFLIFTFLMEPLVMRWFDIQP